MFRNTAPKKLVKKLQRILSLWGTASISDKTSA